jgi:hypothetical protein
MSSPPTAAEIDRRLRQVHGTVDKARRRAERTADLDALQLHEVAVLEEIAAEASAMMGTLDGLAASADNGHQMEAIALERRRASNLVAGIDRLTKRLLGQG